MHTALSREFGHILKVEGILTLLLNSTLLTFLLKQGRHKKKNWMFLDVFFFGSGSPEGLGLEKANFGSSNRW